jgi:outer membrane receptor protein involved in Fe transport
MAAQAQEQTYRFDIPAQSLGSALRAFGQASNQQIIFSEDVVRGKQSAALVGTFTVDNGLQQMISGSGLTVSRTTSGVLSVGNGSSRAEGPAAEPASGDVVVITGTRIRRTETETAAPVTMFTAEDLTERGYLQVGEMLNKVTSNVPSEPVPPFQGVFVFGQGRHSPNLFNLGPGRTLTLVNGRRMVTSSSGLGDRVVDSNVIPTGLIERVDIVQAGGAAVYGSDAIAGVVNYLLKPNFQGLEVDAQWGISSRSDNEKPALRLTAGMNFDDGRGNIATNLEWSKTEPLLEYDRPTTSSSPRTVTNPLNTSTTDGQPPQVYIFNARGWTFNRNGVVFTANSSAPSALLQVNGRPVQFSADGQSLIPYDTGVIPGNSGTQAVGGDGIDFREISSLTAGVERYSGTVIGHYDLTDAVKLSGEFVYGKEEATDPIGTQSILKFINGAAASGQGPFSFNRNNPYLTATQISQLSAASPTFASGGNLILSRFMDILPTRQRFSDTETWRGLVALEGEGNIGGNDLYWQLSFSRGKTLGESGGWAPYTAHLNNALDTVRNSAGQIVCAINADATTANDDPACAPLNPFGNDTATPAARAYVSAMTGNNFENNQDDILATLGGDLFQLPGGKSKFSVAYEHRYEDVVFKPFPADEQGLLFSGTKTVVQGGKYDTDEYSAEVLLPIFGENFTLPFVKAMELNATYRFVDHSVAGEEEVWGTGLHWEVGYGITLRGSKSRNFRAPTLDQQFAPATTNTTFLGSDPCDADRINGGPAPSVRLANCQAEWAAHPGYGNLATFQDPAENTSIVLVATGGNPDLRNEISNTDTFGIVFQPEYIPGLLISADSIDVDLRDALSSFSPAAFMAQCYDLSPQPADFCSTFTRNGQGVVATARQTTFNAGFTHYKGEIYNINYGFELGNLFGGQDWGNLNLGVEATHNRLLETSVTGFTITHSEGTTSTPDWRTRFDARWSRGPLRVFYSIYFLPEAKSSYLDTIETTQYPIIADNMTHTLSAQYDFGRFTVRAGVNNLTDKMPSFPTRGYGDFYGRQYFVGVRARY